MESQRHSQQEIDISLRHRRARDLRRELRGLPLEQFRNYCGLKKIARCGFPWEKTTKRPGASVYTHRETAPCTRRKHHAYEEPAPSRRFYSDGDHRTRRVD